MSGRKLWWYVSRRMRITNEPVHYYDLLVGPFASRKEAAPYCAGIRYAASQGHPVGGYDGHESIGVSQHPTRRPGSCNAALLLPVEQPADPTDPGLAASRLAPVPTRLEGWGLWDGSEEDCLAFAKERGAKPIGRKSRCYPEKGSLPERMGRGAGGLWYNLGNRGLIRELGPGRWRLTLTPLRFWSTWHQPAPPSP